VLASRLDHWVLGQEFTSELDQNLPHMASWPDRCMAGVGLG